MIEVYNEKKKEEQKAGLLTAFYYAYFSRLEKLSKNDLQRVYDAIDKSSKKEMTDAEMYQAIRKYNAAFGGE